MEYTIKELATLAGVTPRTLRWYDKEGLLRPLRTTEAGYRIYGPREVDRLQQILFYRELGLELAAIRTILEDPEFDREAALQSHLAELEARRARLDVLILTVEKTLQSQNGGITMSDKEKFEGLKQEALAENERKYGAETREKYGEKTVEESNRKFANLTQEQYEAMNGLGERILAKLEAAVREGADPSREAGKEIAALHREWLSYTWPSYSVEAHKGLAQMYVDDERFTAYYDKRVKGCAQFLRDAVRAL
ncbi:MAG: MerR family transcriptional regulator [Clostridia bacterium]|nr:MerR family transcriptional regulator [Clostridia bacterium]